MPPTNTYPNYDNAPHRRRLAAGPAAPPLTHNSSSADSQMSAESQGMLLPMNQQSMLSYQTSPDMGMHDAQLVQNEQEWWSANGFMPSLNTSIDQMGDLHLQNTQSHSPIGPDEFMSRRASMNSNSDLADWQEKVRVERRKVQNRAAQRAYRERKEKALTDLRELLDKKDNQFQALQQDHKQLQQQYERLLVAKQGPSGLSTTLAPNELFPADTGDGIRPNSMQQDHGDL